MLHRHLRPLGLLAVLLGCAGSVQAQSFSSVVVFGDSLSDAGNLAQSLGLPAGSSFTTNPDPVWSKRVAETFGASGAPSLAGGPIHAWGGACVNPEGPCRFQVPTLAAQVSGYLSARPARRADPNALYVVWGGGNDISSVLAGSADPQALQSGTVAAAGALVAQVQALRDAGARHVVVLNLPDLGLAPIARRAGALDPRVPATLSALTDAYNAALAAGVRTHEDGIVPIDAHGLLDELVEDPGRYGFTDIHGTACSPGTNALVCGPRGSGTPETYAPGANRSYLFADDNHPSGAAHAMIANAVTSTLTAPVHVSLAGEGGVEMAGVHRDAVSAERASDLALERPVGSWRGYARGRIGKQRLDVSPRLGEARADTRGLTLGTSHRAGLDLYWGAALSLGRHDNAVSGAKLDGDGAIVSLHGTWRRGGLHVSGALSMGKTSVDVERSISFGPATRVERGSTDAKQLGADLELGWILGEPGGSRQGPFLGLSWLDQEVDAYRERGSSALSMHFSGFDRDSLLVRGGYRVEGSLDGRFGALRPHAGIAYERELDDGPISVTAGSNTMPGRFTLSGFAPSRAWASADLGLSTSVGEQGHAFAAYTGRFGGSRRDHQLSLGLSIAF